MRGKKSQFNTLRRKIGQQVTLIGLDLQWILFEHQKRQLTLFEVHLWRNVNMKDANKLIFSPDDLAASLGVQRGTIYRWRKQGRLPQGFLLSPSNRRWHVNELARHSNELALAFSHCLDSTPTLSKDFAEDPNG